MGAETTFDAVQTELVDDQEIEAGIKADAIMDGLIGQGRGQIFQEQAAGRVQDPVAEHASGLSDVLDQPALSQARLANEDDVLVAANEVPLGEGFDLRARDGGVEVPIEGAERLEIAEVGVPDEAFDAALTAQSSLIGEQTMEEVAVGQAGVLSKL